MEKRKERMMELVKSYLFKFKKGIFSHCIHFLHQFTFLFTLPKNEVSLFYSLCYYAKPSSHLHWQNAKRVNFEITSIQLNYLNQAGLASFAIIPLPQGADLE
jgi:hypothetical protein